MLIKLMNAKLWVVSLFALSIISCSDNPEVADAESFGEETVFIVNRDANAGAFGCFEIVFPLSIKFEDGTVAEVADYEDLKETAKAWKEDNPNATQRPTLVFPIEIMDSDGEMISIGDRMELREVVIACKRDFYQTHRPHHMHHKHRCFRLVFPLSLTFPDGTTVVAEDRRDAKQLLRTWKINNPGSTDRPVIVFPVDVYMRDGTITTVDSKEALRALKEDCAG